MDDNQGDNNKNHYFNKQLIETAKSLNYFASYKVSHKWVRVKIQLEHTFEYIISFHVYNRRDMGIMAVSAFTDEKIRNEEGNNQFTNVLTAALELFQYNYKERYESIEKRFIEWLEVSITIAMEQWNKSLRG